MWTQADDEKLMELVARDGAERLCEGKVSVGLGNM